MHCDEACGQREASLVPQDFQDHLSSETVYARGILTLTTVELGPFVGSTERQRHRWVIFSQRAPFSAELPLLCCSQNLHRVHWCVVSEHHVLTAAHCSHDGKDYIKGATKIKMGFLTRAQNTGSETELGKLVKCTQAPKGWIWGSDSINTGIMPCWSCADPIRAPT
ncbi:unnamed protein product [Lepidochelys kempii]